MSHDVISFGVDPSPLKLMQGLLLISWALAQVCSEWCLTTTFLLSFSFSSIHQEHFKRFRLLLGASFLSSYPATVFCIKLKMWATFVLFLCLFVLSSLPIWLGALHMLQCRNYGWIPLQRRQGGGNVRGMSYLSQLPLTQSSKEMQDFESHHC